MAASKGAAAAAVLVMAAHLLLMPLAAMAADPVSSAGEQVKAAAAQVQEQVPERELGNCGAALGSCRTSPCCDEKNFGCSYTQVFGVPVLPTCRPLSTCVGDACTLRVIAETLPPKLTR